MNLTWALLGFAICIAAWLLFRRSEPSGWSAGPIINGKNYSAGVSVDSSGLFDFPQAPASVHYVTKACGSLSPSATVRLSYRIDADPGVVFHPASVPAAPSIGPVLYFQREGDDWSGVGQFETYRWWATFAAPSPITPGEHEVIAPLSARWTAVETSNADDYVEEFRAALRHAARIGFTFGGGTGYGHGVYAEGKARFTVLSFEVA